jgi:hypothetical protein
LAFISGIFAVIEHELLLAGVVEVDIHTLRETSRVHQDLGDCNFERGGGRGVYGSLRDGGESADRADHGEYFPADVGD